MTRRNLTDAERIVSIREVIEAARGDWHEATALWSIGTDLDWLLGNAERFLDTARDAVPVNRDALRTAIDLHHHGEFHCGDTCVGAIADHYNETVSARDAVPGLRERIAALPYLDVNTEDGGGGRMVALDAVLAALTSKPEPTTEEGP